MKLFLFVPVHPVKATDHTQSLLVTVSSGIHLIIIDEWGLT